MAIRVPMLDSVGVGLQNPTMRSQAPSPWILRSALDSGGRESMQLGTSLVRGGLELNTLVQQQQQLTDQAAAKDAAAKATSFITDTMYSPGGYLSQQGKSALDAAQPTQQAVTDHINEIRGSLQNPRQQALFMRAAQPMILNTQRTIAAHAAKANIQYNLQSSVARSNAAAQQAVQSFALDPSPNNIAAQQALTTQQLELENQGRIQGLSGDALTQFVNSGLGKTYTVAAQNLINSGNVPVAEAFLQQHGAEIAPAAHAGLLKALDAAKTKDSSIALSIQLNSQHPDDIMAQQKTLDQMFKDKQVTADVYNATQQKLRADHAQQQEAYREQDKQTLGHIWDAIQNGNVTSPNDLNPTTLAYIQQRGLGGSVTNMFKNAKNPGADDPQLYLKLVHQAYTDPTAFGKENIVQYYGQLNPAHRRSLESLQGSVWKNGSAHSDPQTLVYSTVRAIKANMQAAGFELNPKDRVQAQQLAQFESALYDAIGHAVQQNPNMTPEQARNVGLSLLKNEALSGPAHSVFGFGFGGHKRVPVWQMTPEQKAQPWDIPHKDRTQIIDSLSRGGIPVTEQNIQQVYKRAHGVYSSDEQTPQQGQ